MLSANDRGSPLWIGDGEGSEGGGLLISKGILPATFPLNRMVAVVMRKKPTIEFKNKVRYYVVANRMEANIYRSTPEVRFKFLERLKNRLGGLMESELDSDGPGTGWSSAGGGTIRHSLDRTFHHHEKILENFAKEISDYLEDGWRKDLYGELVLVCDPHLLGLMREKLSSHVKKLVLHEINREYLQGSDQEIYAMIQRAIESRSELHL